MTLSVRAPLRAFPLLFGSITSVTDCFLFFGHLQLGDPCFFTSLPSLCFFPSRFFPFPFSFLDFFHNVRRGREFVFRLPSSRHPWNTSPSHERCHGCQDAVENEVRPHSSPMWRCTYASAWYSSERKETSLASTCSRRTRRRKRQPDTSRLVAVLSFSFSSLARDEQDFGLFFP